MVIAGYGYVGERLARAHLARGDTVVAIRRSDGGPPPPDGARPLSVDLARLDLHGLGPLARIYYLAPPPRSGVDDPTVAALCRAAAGLAPATLVYVGTTGVYGDRGGDWIDETAPLRPGNDRARRRVAAEGQVRALLAGAGWKGGVLRAGGIYGPDRLPLERLRRGEPVLCPEIAPFSNRIHVDDLVAACLALADRGLRDEVVNAVDGRPSTMTDWFYAVADEAGLPRPPCIDLAEAERRLSPAMMEYLRESRRIRNERLRERLGVTLRYPDLRAGIRASLGPGEAVEVEGD